MRFVFFFLLLNVNGGLEYGARMQKKREKVMEFAIFLLYLPI